MLIVFLSPYVNKGRIVSGFRRDVNGIWLFWYSTQRRMVTPYRRFGITYRPHLQGSSGPRRTWTAWP